ncbi:hypothetical protein HispidOSU_027875, partial [Sigmodon hispidus]
FGAQLCSGLECGAVSCGLRFLEAILSLFAVPPRLGSGAQMAKCLDNASEQLASAIRPPKHLLIECEQIRTAIGTRFHIDAVSKASFLSGKCPKTSDPDLVKEDALGVCVTDLKRLQLCSFPSAVVFRGQYDSGQEFCTVTYGFRLLEILSPWRHSAV